MLAVKLRQDCISYGVDKAPFLPQSLQFSDGLVQRYQFPFRLRFLVITVANIHRARFFFLGSHH